MEAVKQRFGLSKKVYVPDLQPSIEGYAASFVAAQGPMPANEEQSRRDLEINIHTIEDEGLLRILDALCIVKDKVPTGYFDERQNPVYRDITYLRPWAMALRVAATKVIATRFITKYDATTYKIKLRTEVAKIKLKMSRNDRDYFGDFVNQVLIYCETALDDATDGQKMMSLKVQHRELRVGLSKNKG